MLAWLDLNVTDGTVVRVLGTTQYMRSLGCEPVLFTTTQPPAPFRELCDVVVVPNPKLYRPRSCIFTAFNGGLKWARRAFSYDPLVLALQQAKLDLVHCHQYPSAVSLFPLRSALDCPVIYDQHGILAIQVDDRLSTYPCLNKLFLPIELRAEREIYAAYDAFCANTGRVKQLIIDMFRVPEEKVFVIPDGTNLEAGFNENVDEMRAHLDQQLQLNREKVVAFVGGFKPLGGIMDLVRAYHLVYQRRPDTSLMLIGAGDLWSEVTQYVATHGLRRVKMLGRLPYQEAMNYLKAADVVVVPERDHLHNKIMPPLKLLDCLVCGTPVVATGIPDARELITDGKNGIIVRPNDPADLAAGIERVLASESLRREIRANALAMFPPKYVWRNIATQVVDMYETVLSRSSLRSG